MDKLREYISGITGFSDESWEALYACASEAEYRKGSDLLREGEVCHSIFFISSGFCKSCHNVDGREINTCFYFENEFATNIKSLTSASGSEYFIRAGEKLKVVRLDRGKLLQAYSKSHQVETFGRKVLELIMLKQGEHADSFKLLTPRQRYERLVSMHPGFLQRVSLTQAASYLGISRETLSRLRGKR